MKDFKSQLDAHINNLFHRYQNYDNDGVKYAFDIKYTMLNTNGETHKAKRRTGADVFRRNINELMTNFQHVTTVTVTDYAGTNAKAVMLNPPVVIEFMDIQIPNVMAEAVPPTPKSASMDVLQGLSGLFAGTEFEGLGNLAPLAKFMDDKHTIDRLREKHDEQNRRIAELERQKAELTDKYETLNGRYDTLHNQYGELQEDAADLEDELDEYRNRDKKQDKWVSMLGAAGASVAKNFLRQNPAILSGIIPAEQLAGILSDEEPAQTPAPVQLSDEEQARLEDATTVFEWLQGLDNALFEKVIGIIATIRQNTDYADHIIAFLQGERP